MTKSDLGSSSAPPEGYSPLLYNEDLAPVKNRNWKTYNIFSMWMQDIHSITVYTFAASLFFLGLNGYQVFGALIISILLIWLLMNLSGIAGQRTGVPFPVLARASFGVFGANIPALIRAAMGITYYGVLTYLGSLGIQIAVLRVVPSTEELTTSSFLGLSALGWICFGVMWVIQLLVVRHGMDTIRRFQDWAGPAIWVMMFIIMAWMIIKAGGFSQISFDIAPDQAEGGRAWYQFAAAVALNVSFFSTLLLNFADFGRLAKNRRTVVRGNFLGLPVNFTLFAIVSVTCTSASIAIFGTAITDPVELIERTDSTTAIIIGSLVFIVATIGINIVADFVSCAFDLANVAPRHINFTKGGIIAAVLSILPQPWHLYNNPESIKYFVGGLGAFLGPLFGVMIVDYWIIRKGRVDVPALFTAEKTGRYYYTRGVNMRAVWACIPSTVIAAVIALVPAFGDVAPFSWAIGAALGGIAYLILARRPADDQESSAGPGVGRAAGPAVSAPAPDLAHTPAPLKPTTVRQERGTPSTAENPAS